MFEVGSVEKPKSFRVGSTVRVGQARVLGDLGETKFDPPVLGKIREVRTHRMEGDNTRLGFIDTDGSCMYTEIPGDPTTVNCAQLGGAVIIDLVEIVPLGGEHRPFYAYAMTRSSVESFEVVDEEVFENAR